MLTDEERKYINAHADHLRNKLQLMVGKSLIVIITEGNPRKKIVTRDTILSAVAAVTRLTVEKICSQKRTSPYVDARCIAIQLMRKHTAMSTTAIGRVFRRDHSTVINMLRQFDIRMQFSPQFKQNYNLTESQINQFLKSKTPKQ